MTCVCLLFVTETCNSQTTDLLLCCCREHTIQVGAAIMVRVSDPQPQFLLTASVLHKGIRGGELAQLVRAWGM